MLEKNRIYYSYPDLLIKPSRITKTEHRKEGLVFDKEGYLPLFTSPMTCVVNDKSYKLFESNHIHAIYPRWKDSLEKRLKLSYGGYWAAYSLNEFYKEFCNTEKAMKWVLNEEKKPKVRVLIDVANGHMRKIYTYVKECKDMWKDDIEIMVGNISNPETYRDVYEAGVDYIRLSVGTGFGCITLTQTGIGYPIASLIDDTVAVRNSIEGKPKKLPKIIADGGIRNYDDIIKALALGADYVMVGSVFCKMYESAGETKRDGIVINQYESDFLPKDATYTKIYYGMASHYGQKDMGIEKKTAEGTVKTIDCEYTMSGWVDNFIDYLRSSMSYIDCRNVADIYKKAKVIIRSQASIGSVNK